jgi:multiple sugar transport system permease protein
MKSNQTLAAWVFTGPALIVIGLFFLVPVLLALGLSFTDFDIYALASLKNVQFVGFDNYLTVLRMGLFWKALGNTLYFVVVGVPLSIAAALGAALLVHSRLARWKGFFRTALFTPVVANIIAVAVIWKYLFQQHYGVVNYVLGWFGVQPIDWLGNPHMAMPTIIFFALWKNFGYAMIIVLAGLQAIPDELYEAARLDGASAWKQVRHITLPMLGPTLMTVGLLTMVGYFQLFAEPYVMTEGGPLQSTLSVLYLMYNQGFDWWNLGLASAIAFTLFVFTLAATFLLVRVGRRKGWV